METPPYNPGPLNKSVLNHQSFHRCVSVWENPNFDAELRISKYDRNIYLDKKEGKRHWKMIEYLKEAGLHGPAHLPRIKIDHGLITALVERWRPEVHAFHLPFGEVGITLQDVQVLLGLRVDGLPVTGCTHRSVEKWLQRCEDILGFRPKNRKSVTNTKMVAPEIDDVGILKNDSSEVEVAFATRRLMMHMFAGLLFPDTTKNMRHIFLLDLIADFKECGKFSWGSAVLAYLYRNLCRASNAQSSTIGGCVYLLQIWAWERLPMVKPQGVLPLNDIVDMPYTAKWGCKRSWKDVATHTVRTYRDQLDCAQEKSFKFIPYPPLPALPEYCRSGSDVWVKIVPLIFFYMVEHYYPYRFCRQFNCVQDVHREVKFEAELHKIDDRADKTGKNCEDVHAKYVDEWKDMHLQVNLMQQIRDGIPSVSLGYQIWFYKHGRRSIGNPAHHPEDGYIQLAGNVHELVHTLRYLALYMYGEIEKGSSNHAVQLTFNASIDKLNSLGYGWILHVPNDDHYPAVDVYYQARKRDKKRERGHLKGQPGQGGRRVRERSQPVGDGGGESEINRSGNPTTPQFNIPFLTLDDTQHDPECYNPIIDFDASGSSQTRLHRHGNL